MRCYITFEALLLYDHRCLELVITKLLVSERSEMDLAGNVWAVLASYVWRGYNKFYVKYANDSEYGFTTSLSSDSYDGMFVEKNEDAENSKPTQIKSPRSKYKLTFLNFEPKKCEYFGFCLPR